MITAPTTEETYTAYGNISRLFTHTGPEVMLTGPAGTGKSRANLEYLNYWAMEYPGCRLLMVRKTRRSLTESGMVTLEQKVLHPAQGVYFSSSKQQYQYPNGSIIAVAGLDKPSKIMSSEWDIIYPQEATELEEDDWEMCSIRLRNGRLPVQQMIGDCNPGPSTHWIKQRASAKRLRLLETRHEDNPMLYDRHGVMTAEGERYLERLDQLTGVRYARYRKGLWVSAEGMVYEDSWDPNRNVIDRSVVSKRPRDLMGDCGIPLDWSRYLVVDFGFNHPFVCLWCARDPDGRLYVYRQIYKTKVIVEDHAKEIKRVSRWGQPGGDPLPREIICDHDAEDRATLERHLGLITMPAYKSVSDGIQAVASRFRPSGDGSPRLMILRDSLVERDRDLATDKKPTCTEDEPEGYIWDTRQGMKKGEHPVKEEDDGCFVAGTMVTTTRGDVPIEHIAAGDYVLTRNGYKRVKDAGMTAQWAEVRTVHLSNGGSLTGTASHPVYVHGQRYIPLRALRYGDKIEDINSYKERYPLCENQPTNQSRLSTKALLSGAILIRQTGQTRVTIAQMPVTSKRESAVSIKKSGRMHTGRSQRDVTFITKTRIPPIMHWKTWSASRQRRMLSIILNTLAQSKQHGDGRTSKKSDRWLPLGTSQKQVELGTRSLARCHTRMQNTKPTCVSTAEMSLCRGICGPTIYVSALPTARHMHAGTQVLTTKHASVSYADLSLLPIATQRRDFALLPVVRSASANLRRALVSIAEILTRRYRAVGSVSAHPHVLTVTSTTNRAHVYNLTVENPDGEGEYFANGVLVHNCDCLRYIVARFDVRPTEVKYSGRIY